MQSTHISISIYYATQSHFSFLPPNSVLSIHLIFSPSLQTDSFISAHEMRTMISLCIRSMPGLNRHQED